MVRDLLSSRKVAEEDTIRWLVTFGNYDVAVMLRHTERTSAAQQMKAVLKETLGPAYQQIFSRYEEHHREAYPKIVGLMQGFGISAPDLAA